ncbi:MAG: AMP-binding protein, partial [Myxococcota bacterium]
SEHQRLTFGSLLQSLPIERDPSRLPLVSTLFNLDQALAEDAYRFEGLKARYAGSPRAFEVFDIFLNVVAIDGRLELECQYNCDLFSEATIDGWLAAYGQLLKSIAEQPDAPLDALDYLSEADRAFLAEWNDTSLRFEECSSVPAWIDQQAQSTPEAPALVFGDAIVSYRELKDRSDQLAQRLWAWGARDGELIGLCVERSEQMVIAALAIQKLGAAYVPLDPHFPSARLRAMIDDAPLNRIVVDKGSTLPDGGYSLFALEGDIAPPEPAVELPRVDPDAIAYVIYTSGSTGRPKGVQIRQRSVVSFLASMRERPGFAAQDTLLAITTLSFDISVLELMLPLVCGGKVVVASREDTLDGHRLLDSIRRHGVTVMQGTPASFRLLIEAG